MLKPGKILRINLNVKNDKETGDAYFNIEAKGMPETKVFVMNLNYMSTASGDDSLSPSSSLVSTMSLIAVKKALKPFANDSNLVDSIKVTGFTIDDTNGAVIIKTADYGNIVLASDCAKTSYVNVNSNQLANVNDDNIATTVQNYENESN